MGFFGPDRVFSTDAAKRGQKRQYDSLTGTAAGQGTAARGAYLSRSLGFDPSQAVTQYGQGFMDEATEQLGESFQDLTGGAVGSGRMRTGFFQRDAGRMFQDFNRRVANAIAAQSLNAASMDLQNIQGLGAYGQDMFRQQANLVTGAMDRATAEDNARPSGWDIFSGAAGGLLGMGMPGGGSLGGALLSKIPGL